MTGDLSRFTRCRSLQRVEEALNQRLEIGQAVTPGSQDNDAKGPPEEHLLLRKASIDGNQEIKPSFHRIEQRPIIEVA